MTLLIERSFEGVMSAYLVVADMMDESRLIFDANEAGIFDEVLYCVVDFEQIYPLLDRLNKKIPNTLKEVSRAICCEELTVFNAALMALKKAIRYGDAFVTNTLDADMLCISKASMAVSKEAHKLKGLTRFKESTDGLFIAKIAPKYRILHLLAPHFAKRFAIHSWVIVDEIRNEAVMFDTKKLFFGSVEFNYEPIFSEEEESFQILWRRFFNTLAIKERENKKLQQSHIPKRFWKYLIENIG